MYKVIRQINFNYGHRLMNYKGKCAHLHGHNGKVLVEVSSEKLNALGMVMDFYDIRKVIENWINETLDHRMILHEKDPLVPILKKEGEPIVVMKENPTAEAIAKWIFEEARHQRLPVSQVTLWETDDSAASYHE